jgi:hypothetical protein
MLPTNDKSLLCLRAEIECELIDLPGLKSVSDRDNLAIIQTIFIEVHQAIINPPEGKKNVTEWCKHEGCWKMIRELEIEM